MRYLETLKTARYTPASLALILMNLLPLIGVIFFNCWDNYLPLLARKCRYRTIECH